MGELMEFVLFLSPFFHEKLDKYTKYDEIWITATNGPAHGHFHGHQFLTAKIFFTAVFMKMGRRHGHLATLGGR